MSKFHIYPTQHKFLGLGFYVNFRDLDKTSNFRKQRWCTSWGKLYDPHRVRIVSCLCHFKLFLIFTSLFELTWCSQEVKLRIWPENNWLKSYFSCRYQQSIKSFKCQIWYFRCQIWRVKVWFVDNKELQYSSTPMYYSIRTKCSQQRPVSPGRNL